MCHAWTAGFPSRAEREVESHPLRSVPLGYQRVAGDFRAGIRLGIRGNGWLTRDARKTQGGGRA